MSVEYAALSEEASEVELPDAALDSELTDEEEVLSEEELPENRLSPKITRRSSRATTTIPATQLRIFFVFRCRSFFFVPARGAAAQLFGFLFSLFSLLSLSFSARSACVS